MKVGLVGCGNISETYFNCQKIFNNFEITTCSDIDQGVADKSAKDFNVKVQTVDELMLNKEIDLILNLTTPSAHNEIIMRTLKAGKHCFSEKPLAMNFKEGKAIQELAIEKNLFVGCAPDTFLGAACQKTREIIDSQKIGNIVLGTFNLMSHGMEHWHPNPDFFFKPGGGPIFDIGVYYITQLVNLLGPVESIIGVRGTAVEERTITSKPRYGKKIKVETPTTLIGILHFANKVKVQFFSSWDVWKHKHTDIELYGLNGSMILPDPNFFGGEILISNKDSNWETMKTDNMLLGIPNTRVGNSIIANYRGIGLSDMVNNIPKGKNGRCSIEIALHVLEVMEGILISSENSRIYNTTTTCERPEFLEEETIKILKV